MMKYCIAIRPIKPWYVFLYLRVKLFIPLEMTMNIGKYQNINVNILYVFPIKNTRLILHKVNDIVVLVIQTFFGFIYLLGSQA